MSIIDNAIDGVKSIFVGAEKRRHKREALKEIETQAFKDHKEYQEQLQWEEEKQKAAERGKFKAETTPAERIKISVAEKREQIKEKKAKKVAERAVSKEVTGDSKLKKGMKNMVVATAGQKKSASTILGVSSDSANKKSKMTLVKK